MNDSAGAPVPSSQSGLDQWAAAETSAQTDETSYWHLYAKYRHRWPNYVLLIMIIAGEGAIVLLVWREWNAL